MLVGYEAGSTQKIDRPTPFGPVFFNVPGQVVRDEYLRGREVTATGTSQSQYLPIVVYLEFGCGYGRSNLLLEAAVFANNPGSGGNPISVADAAAKGPGSGQNRLQGP